MKITIQQRLRSSGNGEGENWRRDWLEIAKASRGSDVGGFCGFRGFVE